MKTPVVLRNTFWEWVLAACAAGTSVLVLMLLMKLRDRPFSIYGVNKAAALTAVALVLAAIGLGSLYRTTAFNRTIRYRRPLGILAVILMSAHACLSFVVLSESYKWAYYASNWEALLYGFLALIGFLLLALTSYPFAYRRMGDVAWKRLQNALYVLLALSCLHFCHLGKPCCWLSWLEEQDRNIPPLSLIIFLGMVLIVAIRLLEPLFRREGTAPKA